MKLNYFKHEKDLVTFKAGEIVFKEGDEGDFMYGIIAGELQIVYHGTVLETLSEGGFVGEMAIVGDHHRSADVIALTDCTVASVNHQRFLWLVHETPSFATHVMAVMANRIKHLNQMMS